MSSFLSRTAVAAFAVLAASTSAGAQAPASSDSVAVPAAVNAAVTPAPDAPGSTETILLSRPVTLDPALAFRPAHQEMAPVVRREPLGRPMVLMIVGGALIVTGLLVGDDAAPILTLAGAGIGGYGLYLYLQSPDPR